MTGFIAAALLAVTLEADPAHSTAGFTVKHLMVSTVRGQFDKFSSTVDLNDQDPSRSKVTVKIDAASIDTHNEKRDGHLKSPDFFDAAKCPEITFVSKEIEKSSDKYKVKGDLTMHCQTKPVTLDATFSDKAIKTPFGTMVYAASATGKLKRSEWGLIWNKAIEGGSLVSDEIDLDLNLEYVAKPADPTTQSKAESKAATKPAKK